MGLGPSPIEHPNEYSLIVEQINQISPRNELFFISFENLSVLPKFLNFLSQFVQTLEKFPRKIQPLFDFLTKSVIDSNVFSFFMQIKMENFSQCKFLVNMSRAENCRLVAYPLIIGKMLDKL